MAIDANLIPYWTRLAEDYSNVAVINDDILKVGINRTVDEHWRRPTHQSGGQFTTTSPTPIITGSSVRGAACPSATSP